MGKNNQKKQIIKKIEDIDFNLLCYFKVMFEEKSISNAASKSFITQSAMSQAINRLKNHFNDCLFIRTKAGTVPTKKATQIYQKIIPFLLSIKKELKKLDDFDPKTSATTFRIGISTFYQILVLPDLLKVLQEKAPNIKIELVPSLITDTTYSNLKSLKAGTADLLIGVTNTFSAPFHSETLALETICFLARKEHPIFKENNITLALISSYNFLACPQKFGSFLPGITYLKNKGYNPEIEMEVTDHLVIPFILKHTNMIYSSWIHEAKNYSEHFPFRVIEFENMPKTEVKYAWHQNTNNDPANIFLRNLIKELAYSKQI
jgi:DNA-binding transcriptional LysR family regulator